jgi:gliding motility-associated lipoprotein GldD
MRRKTSFYCWGMHYFTSHLSGSLGLLVLILISFSSCEKNYFPKPKGYNKFVLPDAAYQITPDTLPYSFEYSIHAKLSPDTTWISEPNWVEIIYPQWKASVHITYKSVNNNKQLLREYLDDSYTLVSKHQIKAYAIDEVLTSTPSGKVAIINELDGEVPSQFQFTMTDSSQHFLRGALYFNTKVQNDSLAPAIAYIKKDMMQLINTLEWRK